MGKRERRRRGTIAGKQSVTSEGDRLVLSSTHSTEWASCTTRLLFPRAAIFLPPTFFLYTYIIFVYRLQKPHLPSMSVQLFKIQTIPPMECRQGKEVLVEMFFFLLLFSSTIWLINIQIH